MPLIQRASVCEDTSTLGHPQASVRKHLFRAHTGQSSRGEFSRDHRCEPNGIGAYGSAYASLFFKNVCGASYMPGAIPAYSLSLGISLAGGGKRRHLGAVQLSQVTLGQSSR